MRGKLWTSAVLALSLAVSSAGLLPVNTHAANADAAYAGQAVDTGIVANAGQAMYAGNTAYTELERAPKQNLCLGSEAVKLQSAMQKLWIDHVLWTRSFIVSTIAGLEDQKDVLANLLKNQQDMGDAVKPFYGDKAGNKLAELLKEHILIAGQVIDAAKRGNEADLRRYDAQWHRNADDIAKLLSSVNPNWKQKDLQSLLYTHLQFVTTQVTSRLKKDWVGDITAFNQGEDLILKIADVLAQGIIKQFPKRFK